MNVLVFSASPNHDGLTAACASAAVAGVRQAGGQAEHVPLNDLQIGMCQACNRGWGTCQQDHECQVEDGFQALHARTRQADAYVLVTPVYWGEMSESAKAFTDRLRRCEAVRRDESCLSGKPVIAVAAAGGSGNGTITCLLSMERWIQHLRGQVFDLVPVKRWTREHKLVAIREAARTMVQGETVSQGTSELNIHPTAEIHPTVLLEGKVTVGAYTKIDSGTIITGEVTIGHHTLIRCNVVIRGRNTIGSYTHIYDSVCIEGGRPAQVGSSMAAVPDRSIIGDDCWVNHGVTMHGTQLGDSAAVGLNACCDYNTRLGKGAVLANGSATHHDQVIPENCFAEGVPAQVVQEEITDEDRKRYFGLVPAMWTHYQGDQIEERIRQKQAQT